MTQFDVTSPEGKKFRVTAPDGTTSDKALDYFKSNYTPEEPVTPPSSTVGAATRGTYRGLLPAAGAWAGAETGAGIGGAVGEAIFPLGGGIPGAAIGGLVGGVGGWYAGDKATEGATNLLPEGAKKLIGQDAAQHESDIKNHSLAAGAGYMLPGAVAAAPQLGKLAEIGAKKIGGLTSKAAETVKNSLPGSTAKAEGLVGDIGPVTDESVLGEKMHTDLSTRYDKLVKNRQAQVDVLKKDYLSQPHNTERGIALSYHNYLSNYQKLAARDLTPEESEFIQELKDRIGGDPSMTRIESERRYLGQVASGKIEKYAAIRKILALQIKGELENTIRARVPSGGQFIDAYKNLSQPINLFESTTGGKKIVSEVSPYLSDAPKYDRAVLPRQFFKTKDSINNLLELSGGDKKFVSDAAGEYAASQLKGLSAEQARAWTNKNKIWLDEVPKVQKSVEQYAANLEKVTYTHVRAKKLMDAAAYGGAVAAGGVPAYWITKHLLGF
jgi:hypothetical protein